MSKIHCKLILESNAEHCQQIYTGLAELAHEGFLELEVVASHQFSSKAYGIPLIHCYINKSISVTFDLSDNKKPIDEKAMKQTDYYFKRSFDRTFYESNRDLNRFVPLGLNYLVYSKRSLWLERFHAAPKLKDKLKTALRRNKAFAKLFSIQDSLYMCEQQGFECLPRVRENPKVLFFARTWKPDHVSDPQKKKNRKHINNVRAQIVRVLKKELGDNFIGGLMNNPYTQEMYPDCVISKNITNKKNYLELMKSSDICIATKGLEDSIGWKFAEYVAASKAIVTEKLSSELPGSFEKEKNYLEFQTADECIEHVLSLRNSREKRLEMMQNNYHYYQNYLEPKRIVMNAITHALNCERSQNTS